MFKNILISGLLCTYLSADNFDTFLQKAKDNSPYLSASALLVKQIQQSGNILNRYKNPTLEVEYSSFSPDSGSSDNGYRVNYSQPIRLWNVQNDNKRVSKSMLKNANAIYLRYYVANAQR